MNLHAVLAVALTTLSSAALAQVTVQVPAPVQAPTVQIPAPANGPILPFAGYTGVVAGDELFTILKQTSLFQNLSKDLVGCPITLRVTHSFQPTAGGMAAGLASAIWSGSTLGLLPVVIKNDVVITYDLMVNGTVLTSHAYRRNLTKAVNIWSNNDTTYGLGKDGLVWAKETASQFAQAMAGDPKLAELIAEYEFYFGKAQG